jgi:hypothetical protein
MRTVGVAAMILMLALARPAYAQSNVKGQTPGPPPPAPMSPQEIQAERAAEKAYKSSLGNIPDQPAADPWGNARSMDAPKAVPKAHPAKSPAKTGGTAN